MNLVEQSYFVSRQVYFVWLASEHSRSQWSIEDGDVERVWKFDSIRELQEQLVFIHCQEMSV